MQSFVAAACRICRPTSAPAVTMAARTTTTTPAMMYLALPWFLSDFFVVDGCTHLKKKKEDNLKRSCVYSS